MKNIIQSIGLLALICFSFMYTDKVIEVINEKDSLKIEIENNKNKYNIDYIEATIEKDTIIPGLNGKQVNEEESYNKMREIGIFKEDYLVYYTTYPKILLKNNYDKYIISGNKSKRKVALIFKIDNDNYIKELIDITNNYNIKINLFVDINYLNNNINKLINKNIELHNYGNAGKYTHENILESRNIIKNKTNKITNYCLNLKRNKENKNNCLKDKLFSIIPSIISYNNPYNDIKNNLKTGNIIYIELNKNNMIELPNIIEFIKGKGIEITTISNLLSEELNKK